MLDDKAIAQAVQDGADEANGLTQTAKELIRGLHMIDTDENERDFSFLVNLRGTEGARITLSFNGTATPGDRKKTEVIDIPTNGHVIVDGLDRSLVRVAPQTGAPLPTHDQTVLAVLKEVSKDATEYHREAEAKRKAAAHKL